MQYAIFSNTQLFAFMAYSNIITEHQGDIMIITIHRPDQLNALNGATIEELNKALALADINKNVRCIILTGSGEKAFVAGADIKEFAQFSIEEGGMLAARGQKLLFDFVEHMSKPVIAAVNGFALGGGLELAMSAHFRVASDNAKMGLPEVTLGVIPGYGGTQRLAQLVGKGKALEMITSAAMITATEALTCGLVNYVVPQGELLPKCLELATKICKNSPTAIAAAIRAVNAGYQDGVDGFSSEIQEFGKCFGTADFKEGTTAFLEKRKPSFTGH
jgi:enoyl-CoA hydratase